jgi:hypothetical protein
MSKTWKAVPNNSAPLSVQDEYGFPEDCLVLEAGVSTGSRQEADKKMMIIVYAGAPAALFNNAPLGAFLLDTTNLTRCMKTAAAGTGTVSLGAATETGTALGLVAAAGARGVALGVASETATALGVVAAVGASTVAVGAAVVSETALGLTATGGVASVALGVDRKSVV